MADENLNPRRDELRQAISDFMASGQEQSIDRMTAIMDTVIREAKADAKAEAKAEAQREADNLVPIPNLALDHAGGYYDAIQQRLIQVRGIVDLMSLAADGEIEDATLPNAAWAVKHLLDEVDELASRGILRH
jgi:hypothetical protein